MMKSRAYVIGQILAAASFILAAGGCTDKAEEDIYPYADANEPIVIRASSEALGVATRAEGEEVTPEWITDGKYLFTYPLSADGKEMASLVCEFKEGYGYIYKENADLLKKGELQYDGGSKVYLDNLVNYKVDGPVGQGTDNFTCIEFGISAESGFTPSLMYARADDRIVDIGDKKVDVDILWDSTVPTRDARSIDFKLKHKMSRVTFRFHSEEEEIKNLLKNRDNIKVTLNMDYLDDQSIQNLWRTNKYWKNSLKDELLRKGFAKLNEENERMLMLSGGYLCGYIMKEGSNIDDASTWEKIDGLVIPDNVKTIGSNAFAGYTICSMTLGSSVECIDTSAFGGDLSKAGLTDDNSKEYAVIYIKSNNIQIKDNAFDLGSYGYVKLVNL